MISEGLSGARLPRSLSAASVVGLTLSALSPAASVYVTGSSILHIAGTGAVLAVAIGGTVILLAASLYAEIGAAFPSAGGIYPGIGAILGPAAARVAIVLGLITSPALLAFVALGLADYVHVYAPSWPRGPVAVGVIAAACLIASTNLRVSARIAMMLLLVEVLALVVLVVVGVSNPARSIAEVILHPQTVDAAGVLQQTPLPTLLIASVAGAFACSGAGLALYFADDLEGPAQQIGWLVVISGIVTVALVTLPLLFVAIGTRDLARTLQSDVPIAAFMTERVGAIWTMTLVVAVILAIFNNLIASTMAFGRFLYATGVDGIWTPAINARLGHLHRRYGSPVVPIGALFVAALGTCLMSQRALLALLSSEIFTALLIVIAVVVGRRRQLTGTATFRSPLFPLSPILGFAVIAVFFTVDWQDRDYARIAVLSLGSIALAVFVVFTMRGGQRVDASSIQ